MATNENNCIETVSNTGEELNEETLYLLKSEANRQRLQEALDELNSGQSRIHELIEE